MTKNSTIWDEEYTRKGKLWAGMTCTLPEIPQGSRILELGCGNGKMLPLMIRRKWDVTAIDFSHRAAGLSKEVTEGASSIKVMVADAGWLPFRDNTFDAIFALHCIGHMHRPGRDRIAREIVRTLNTGGTIQFSGFTTDDFRFGKGNETEPGTFRRGNGIDTHYFTKCEVSDLFSNLIHISTDNHQWPMRVRGKNLIRSEIIGLFKK